MKALRATLLLAVLIALFLWLDPRQLPPRVTPPEKRNLSLSGDRLMENGVVLVHVGSTRDEVETALGGPERTETGEWIYPLQNFKAQLLITFRSEKVTGLAVSPAK